MRGALPLPLLYRLSYWIVTIQDSFFLWPVIILIVAIFGYCASAFCRKKPNNLSEMAQVTVYILVIQILLCIISFSIRTSGVQRYICHPALLALLICYCLMRIGKRLVIIFVIVPSCSSLSLYIFLVLGLFSISRNINQGGHGRAHRLRLRANCCPSAIDTMKK